MKFQTGTTTVEKTVTVEEPTYITPSFVYASNTAMSYKDRIKEFLIKKNYRILDFRPPTREDEYLGASGGDYIMGPGNERREARFIIEPIPESKPQFPEGWYE